MDGEAYLEHTGADSDGSDGEFVINFDSESAEDGGYAEGYLENVAGDYWINQSGVYSGGFLVDLQNKWNLLRCIKKFN